MNTTDEANQVPPEWAVKAATVICNSVMPTGSGVWENMVSTIIARHAPQPTPPAEVRELVEHLKMLGEGSTLWATDIRIITESIAALTSLAQSAPLARLEGDKLVPATVKEWNHIVELRMKAEEERDALRAEVERLKQEPAYEFDPSTGIATSVPSLRARLAAVTESNAKLTEALSTLYGMCDYGDAQNAIFEAALAADAGKEDK